MTVAIVCFNLLLLAVLWEFFLSGTIIDGARDRLFDLRDNARRWFRDHGEALDSDPHQALRDALNSHLYNVKRVTMTSYIIGMSRLLRSARWEEETRRNEARFAANRPEIQKYIQETRGQAATILLQTMVFRSLPLSLLFTCFAVAVGIFLLCRWLCLRISQGMADSALQWRTALIYLVMAPLFHFSYFAPGRAEGYSVHVRTVAQKVGVVNASHRTV